MVPFTQALTKDFMMPNNSMGIRFNHDVRAITLTHSECYQDTVRNPKQHSPKAPLLKTSSFSLSLPPSKNKSQTEPFPTRNTLAPTSNHCIHTPRPRNFDTSLKECVNHSRLVTGSRRNENVSVCTARASLRETWLARFDDDDYDYYQYTCALPNSIPMMDGHAPSLSLSLSLSVKT